MSCSGKHELHFKVALLVSLFVFGNKQVFIFGQRFFLWSRHLGRCSQRCDSNVPRVMKDTERFGQAAHSGVFLFLLFLIQKPGVTG